MRPVMETWALEATIYHSARASFVQANPLSSHSPKTLPCTALTQALSFSFLDPNQELMPSRRAAQRGLPGFSPASELTGSPALPKPWCPTKRYSQPFSSSVDRMTRAIELQRKICSKTRCQAPSPCIPRWRHAAVFAPKRAGSRPDNANPVVWLLLAPRPHVQLQCQTFQEAPPGRQHHPTTAACALLYPALRAQLQPRQRCPQKPGSRKAPADLLP